MLGDLGKSHQQPRRHKGPQQDPQNGRRPREKAPGPQPVHPLPQDTKQAQALKDPVLRVEAIAPAQHPPVHHKELHRRHPRTNGPDPQKIALPVPGMGKALHGAEQEQRRTEPSQHTEQGGHGACECEKVVDVIQQHQHQRDGLEGCAGESVFLCKHTFHSPFLACLHPAYQAIL